MKMITLHSPVRQVLRNMTLRRGAAVGIELEYEDFNMRKFNLKPIQSTLWILDHDHSLRNGGIELISNVLVPDEVPTALKEAEAIRKQGGGRATIRCGTHIHVNMTDVVMRELWNMSVLYTLAEPTIFKLYADGRQTNHFCVPVWTQTGLGKSFYNDIGRLRKGIPIHPKKKHVKSHMVVGGIPHVQPGHPIPQFMQPHAMDAYDDMTGPISSNVLTLANSSKYSAVNFHALVTHGTLEFRQFRGTNDMDQVQTWINLLLRLRALASEDADPLNIIERYEIDGLPALLERLQLPQADIHPKDQEEAEDVATLMAGYISPNKDELTWEVS